MFFSGISLMFTMKYLHASKPVGFLGDSDDKESACSSADPGSVPGLGRSPGEGNGTYSGILNWRISWTEEPVGLQSMGSQRVRHNWATNTFYMAQVYKSVWQFGICCLCQKYALLHKCLNRHNLEIYRKWHNKALKWSR